MFDFATPRRNRRISLTPMIDVIFLLLVFFMLASRFGQETALPAGAAGSGAAYDGPPRLVEVLPDALMLNGAAITPGALPGALDALTASRGDTIVLRPRDGADVQRLVDVTGALSAAGFTGLVLVE